MRTERGVGGEQGGETWPASNERRLETWAKSNRGADVIDHDSLGLCLEEITTALIAD